MLATGSPPSKWVLLKPKRGMRMRVSGVNSSRMAGRDDCEQNSKTRLTDGDTDDGDEELADGHAGGAPDEERATTEALDGVEGDRGRDDIDNLHEVSTEGERQFDSEVVRLYPAGMTDGEDHGHDERVADSASRLEELSPAE